MGQLAHAALLATERDQCDIWAMRMISLLLTAAPFALCAQLPISGPMAGHVDMMEASIWLQCHGPCTAALAVWPAHAPDSIMQVPMKRSEGQNAHALTFTVGGLRPGTLYHYQVSINGTTLPLDPVPAFRTQPLWRFRTDPPEFTMAMGSCAYVNEPAYDRPGRPYGDALGIFDAIADKEPELMLWLGDNVYLRESDWGSRSGYLHRYTHTRSTPEMQRLLRSTKHYAIWDDHDFGPNDADGSWVHGDVAREVFGLFWPNPTLGVPGVPGITTMFTHADIDLFLIDNRTHRVPGSVTTGEPAMFGHAQLDWLIRALKYSRAPFKLVAVGSQVLNTAAVWETYATMPGERAELLRRIEEEGITGVVFLTGDRHFTELSELKFADGRMVYDITVSPLTSGPYAPQETNDNHVEGTLVSERNFALLSFQGPYKSRVMHIAVHGASGDLLWERSISEVSGKP